MIHSELKEYSFGKHLPGSKFKKMKEEIADHTLEHAKHFVSEIKRNKVEGKI